MEQNDIVIDWFAMYRRWAYMVLAIAASLFLFTRPVFSFHDDKGIIYVRSFTMDSKHFVVTQTELETGAKHVTAILSVKGLYYCNKIMLFGCILCLLCFFNKDLRVWMCNLTALACGAYYVLMLFYAMELADHEYTTLYPNAMAIVPAVILELMILTRQNVIRTSIDEADSVA